MYDELVKKIRHCATDPMHCLSCGEDKDGRCFIRLMTQAADAIEELQQIAGHYEETSKDYFKDACYYRDRVPQRIPVTALPSENGIYLTVSIEPWFGTTVVDTMRWSGVWMMDIPAADVRPVVLCRDCKWCHAGYCEKYDDLIPFGCANKPWEDWFCADGAKREES